jgi:hypothetical protein
MKTYYLKSFKLYILVVCLGLFTTSCDELTMALQYANQSNGGVCIETEGHFGYFNTTDQDYRMDRYRNTNDDGENIASDELSWANSTLDHYLPNMGIYYETSPYSGAEYKFVVTCVTWQEPNQYVTPANTYSPGRN